MDKVAFKIIYSEKTQKSLDSWKAKAPLPFKFKKFMLTIRKNFSPQRGCFRVKGTSRELTAPLRACGHNS